MRTIVLDSGPLIAAFDRTDQHHAKCASFLASLRGRRLLPAPVLVETCWMLERAPAVEAAFLREVRRGTFELVTLTNADLGRVEDLIVKYADLPLGTTDASVIATAERFGVVDVATIDHRHFGIVRPAHVPALTLLP